MDLKKALDTVKHEILQQKLEQQGIHNKELKWLCSYLTKRNQCCKVNGKLSTIESISCGIPQGSCLRPLLFIIYINDLYFNMKHCDLTCMLTSQASHMLRSQLSVLTTPSTKTCTSKAPKQSCKNCHRLCL